MRSKLLLLVLLASALPGCESDRHHRRHHDRSSHFIVVDRRHHAPKKAQEQAHAKGHALEAHGKISHRGLTEAELAAKMKALQQRIDNNRRKLRRN